MLVVLGLLAIGWAAALAAFLVTPCNNSFGFGNAPNLRCLQPVLWELTAAAFVLSGLAIGGAGLILRRKRSP
ncbi:MAG TPA: hypothetical protein VFI53_18680 [Myxococcaceae bacterium]|nr:hypothetical protein [Myxococcaceae bacterium]